MLIQNLPLRWFSKDENLKTNWLIGAFSTFGDIRRFHIPLLDEIEKAKASKSDESEGFKKFNFNSEHQTFDVYLMYKDYVGFVNAMDGLRGMKLVKCRKDADFKTEYTEHEIKIDFDKSKHLSDKAIRRRQIAKKYGINTLEDLNEYKKKAKERKALYEQRMKQLKRHKKRSRNLLDFLARLVAVEQKKREQEELQALNERLLKERLLEEEKKLRNKLIERQRTLMMEKLKEQGKLPADHAKESNGSAENHQHSHASYDRPDYGDDHREYSEHREYSDHREYSNHREYSDHREFSNHREYPDHREYSDHRDHPDRLSRPDHRSVPNRYDDRKADYTFKNPRNANQHFNPNFNPNFGPPGKQTNHFNSHSGQPNTPHYQPHRTARGPNFRPHYQPYQANNQNTVAYSKKSNYYDPEQFEHAERFPTRHDRERFVDRPGGHRFDGYPERAYPADKSDRERSGSYQDRPGYPGNYQARSNYPERDGPERGYQDRGGYPGRDGYPDRGYSDRGYSDRGYQDRGNHPDRLKHSDRGGYPDRPDYRDRAQNYEKPYERSFNKRVHEEEDSRSDEKSSTRPKSMVVLPQK